MPQYPRYAIYFVPPADSAFYRFGASLLGYDTFEGKPLAFPEGIEAQIGGWKNITTDPRKYGFHATLKAPMSLAAGRNETELMAAVQKFVRTPREIPTIATAVHPIGSFIAVIPETPSPALQKLVDDCVTTFDSFRAPLTPEDRARRDVAALTEKQIEYLDRWGYPYVFGEFRFHMTLTGSLAAERRDPILAILQARFAALGIRSLKIGEVALLRQNDIKSNFTVIAHAPLQVPD
jgi:putative phosphonate metabolism protein